MAVDTSHEDHRHNDSDYSAGASGAGDIEQYGVWVKAGPVDIGDEDENVSQYKMEDLEPESADGTLTQEEEELLGSLESEDSAQGDTAQEDSDVGSLPDFGDAEGDELTIEDLDLSSADESADNVEESDLGREEGESLEDIGDLELDLADSKEEEESMAIPEESASILQKIENDLLSIKDELTALKNEIYSLRSGGQQADVEEPREETESGFFEEDEDETIALTGDELDNILNTADITEQTGQSTASPEDTDLLMEENPDEAIIDRDDILTDDVPGEPVLTEEPAETIEPEPLDLDEGDLGLADLASVTEEPTEELSLDEEASADETEMLDLPEEEEIVFDEAPGAEDLSLDDVASEAPRVEDLNLDDVASEAPELGSPEEEDISDLTFELDEDLELSPSEQQDLEESQELLDEGVLDAAAGTEEADLSSELGEAGAEELTSPLAEEDYASQPGEEAFAPEIDDSELAEMESEARDSATATTEAEETLDEAFDLTDEDLELPEIETEELPETSELAPTEGGSELPEDLKSEIRAILKYMDQLLESLPEDKIEEFANSEYFEVYKRLFEELGLTT